MHSISSQRIQSHSYLQFHSFCIEAEKSHLLTHICAHFGKGQLCQPLVTLIDLGILGPLGAKQIEIWTKPGIHHLKNTRKSISTRNTANIWAIQLICSVCCWLLACPSFQTCERVHFSSSCSLLCGLKYDWHSPEDGSMYCIPFLILAMVYNNTQLKNRKHWVIRSISCQSLLSSSLCVCVQPLQKK